MASLREYLNTQYATSNFQGDVRRFCVMNDDIDIARLKLTPIIVDELILAQKNGKHVHDSGNTERDIILENNIIIRDMDIKAVPFPEMSQFNIKQYLASLETGTVYEFSLMQSRSDMYIALAVLTQIYRPDVDVLLDNIIDEIFSLVNTYLYRNNLQEVIRVTDKYLVNFKNRIYPVTITEKELDKQFEVYGLGVNTWNQFLNSYNVIPAYFGEVKISKEPYNVYWQKLILACIEIVKETFEHKRITLNEFLGGALR